MTVKWIHKNQITFFVKVERDLVELNVLPKSDFGVLLIFRNGKYPLKYNCDSCQNTSVRNFKLSQYI